MTAFCPTSENEALDIIKGLLAQGRTLAVSAGRSRIDQVPPRQVQERLDLSHLTGVPLYEPTELVISARAGTPVAEIETLLAEKNQMLPFEAPDYRRLLGTTDTAPSIGGAVSANLAGPRRISAGTLSDYLIGIRAITGHGELVRSGGRVMKNVTGYDLCRLFAGSHGIFGVLSEVTFKVLPRAEATRTLVVLGQEAEAARATLSAALGTPFEVSGAAWLPSALATRLAVPALSDAGRAVTCIRLETFAQFADARLEKVRQAVAEGEQTLVLGDEDSASLWADVRDVAPFALADQGAGPVWQVSVPPMAGPAVIAAVAQSHGQTEAFMDWGGGRVWLRLAGAALDAPDAGAAIVRDAVRRAAGREGTATLIRATISQREVTPGQPEMDPVSARLVAGLKRAFDPQGLIEPDRIGALA